MLTFVPPAFTGAVSPKEKTMGFSPLCLSHGMAVGHTGHLFFSTQLYKKKEREDVQLFICNQPVLAYSNVSRGRQRGGMRGWRGGREHLSFPQGQGESRKTSKKNKILSPFLFRFLPNSFLSTFSYIPIQLTDDPLLVLLFLRFDLSRPLSTLLVSNSCTRPEIDQSASHPILKQTSCPLQVLLVSFKIHMAAQPLHRKQTKITGELRVKGERDLKEKKKKKENVDPVYLFGFTPRTGTRSNRRSRKRRISLRAEKEVGDPCSVPIHTLHSVLLFPLWSGCPQMKREGTPLCRFCHRTFFFFLIFFFLGKHARRSLRPWNGRADDGLD